MNAFKKPFCQLAEKLLGEARSLKNVNYRDYFVRRIEWKRAKGYAVEEMEKDLEQLKRIVVVQNMYEDAQPPKKSDE